MNAENKGSRGAVLLLEALAEEGVEVIFGYPGGVLLPLYDSLIECPIRHILPRHEQGGVHAADGYARATGKVGVCLGTSGPGATNLVTGIATAYMDSVPMVVLTGQVVTSLLGTDSFQEADITGITTPITKHSYIVKDPRDFPRIVKEAFYLAGTGRPGPVLIDLPKDILAAENVVPLPAEMNLKGYKVPGKGDSAKITEAVKAISECKRPVIYIGGGVIASGAADTVRQLSEKTGSPVVSTLMGIGAIPYNHPNRLGMVGMHGTVTANYAIDDCDLLIAVGVRFDDRVTSGLGHRFATKATIIHIDIDSAEISKVVRAHIPILGDANLVLEEILKGLDTVEAPKLADWWERLNTWKNDHPLRYEKNRLTPQLVIETLGQHADDQTVLVTDVGQHQMWSAQFYPVSHARNFLSSGGLGTMGFGLPAAVGAQVARPDDQVFLVTGDGSFQMCIQELATVANHNLPIKIILLNNGVLGMVRQWQKLFYDRRFSGILLESNPDFVKIAEAYGIKGIRVDSFEGVSGAIAEAVSYPGPVLLDFDISPEEDVLPMVAPGKAITEMLGR